MTTANMHQATPPHRLNHGSFVSAIQATGAGHTDGVTSKHCVGSRLGIGILLEMSGPTER